MATSRDIQELVSKLSSDKSKTRDEGMKLLNTWMEGERSSSFFRLLGQNTARMKPNELPHSETWPFLIKLLMKCVSLEIGTSKKRPPRLIFAKTIRTAIQRAEDAKFSGKNLLLLSIVKQIFNHIGDVVRDVPIFQSEYGIILRELMVGVEYRYQIRKQVYSSLLLLYLSKVETTISGKSNSLSCTKEEVFRCIMTLHILLENPPGDFSCSLREHIVKGFIGIFSHIRDEGKISRKLMDCVNTFLLKDGPNLGCLSMEIHSAVQDFVLRFWLGTHDRGLKSALIVYGKAQLAIIRSSNDGSPITEQLLDVISKELDQINPASVGTSWSDASRDDKAGTSVNSHRSLMELAAAVFYQACLNTREQSFEGKTLKREHAATRLKDGLVQGKILWNGSFYFLVHNFHLRIRKHLLIFWFEGISKNFERVLNDSNSTQSYDGMLWLLQSLQELSSLLSFCAPCKGTFQQFYLTSEEILLVRSGWHVIWSCLLHGLPIFSNLTSVADAALKLLSSIISNDLINLFTVPQDVWDLRIFRHMPSSFSLQFVSVYFSSKCAQGNLPEVLQLRKKLLRAVLGLLKDPGALSEPVVWLLPASIFSLCTGCAPFKPSSPSCVEDMMEWMKKEEFDQSIAHQLYDCSVEILAEIATESSVEVSHTTVHHGLRLPQQMRHSLTQEMEEYFLANVILYEEVQKFNLSDLFFLCGLLSNCIYYVFLTRLGESNSSLIDKMVGHILKLLEQIVLVVEKNCVELQQHRCLDTGSIFDVEGRTLTSLRCFLCCPLFRVWVNDADNNLHTSIMHVTERLLFALTKLFSESSQCTSKVECEAPVPCLISSSSNLVENPDPVYDAKVRHVDMELDVDDDSEDMDFFTVSGNNVPGTSFSSVEWKRELVSAISFFFSVSPDATWKVLFNLIGQEDDLKVCEVILFSLCQGYSCSAGTVSDLVCLMNHMLEVSVSPRLCSVGILTAVHSLLEKLLLLFPRGKDETGKKFATGVLEQSLETLGDLLNKIAEIGLPDWSARIKLLECICCFVSLDPHIAQGMIERLLGMLQDTDFRVRVFLAKRIGILFQTWDGHDQLLQDISYNFGIPLVTASNEKLVKAGEVFDVGSNPRPFMETVLVSLAHIAFCSEKVESEVVFMMCVISAMDFRERELVKALLDNLSRKLLYANRTKYFEELMGSILARWVVCEVSLDALVEIQDHFNVTSETSCFMRSCCPWLLPMLILHKQTVNLNWVSMVTGQPISVLVKDYFVEIFSICMALLCSTKGDRENGAMVLRSYILQIAGISEIQRDDLIKRHMVSIVSFLLSLSSSALDPAFPFFSKDVIVLSVRKVVDGFLEMDDHPMSFDILDKINVFRPDRVFMFLVEIHNQITGAVHARHKCHRLSAIEVLVNVIGQRSTVPSTSSYILNLIGQFIADGALQDQCCVILTTLLEVFYKNPVKDILGVLGEQLQFLISKLVACCISSNNLSETSSIRSMKVLILLHQLTVDADPFLYSYIKELEPFPELDCFERIRTFHLELCKLYSPKEHLLKLVKRAGELPRRLLLLSLQSLHKNPLLLEIIRPVRYSENINGKADCWQSDPDIVYAIWALVGTCDSDDKEIIGALVADFISMVGIGDPHRVVFHLPRHTNERFLCPQLDNNSERRICTFTDACVSDETLIKLIKLLKKYLLDASVKTVEITSQTLRGILSTDRGHGAMLSFDSYERSLIAVHSKGVNLEVVEKLLMEFQIRSSEAGSLDDSSLWSTHGKTYEMWICSLVYSLLNHGTDIILRLCQDIVLLKAEVAELLFPNVLVDIAMGKDSKVDICQKISEKVMEYVLFDSNDMIKSVKTMLNALNELRLFHVLERVGASSVQSSQDISKKARTSSYSRMRSTSARYKDQSSPTNVGRMSCILWTKVYWLCIDYLVVAKAAIRCGLYFTAVLYVEHWCEEHFNGLTLGDSDFSLHEELPAHIELLVAAITRINEPDSIYGIIQSHKLTSQIKMYEHEGDWGKVLEYCDLLIRMMPDKPSGNCSEITRPVSILMEEKDMEQWKSCKGLMRALQNTGCTHILDVYCRGLVNQKGHFQSDSEFTELQYEAAWRAGNWDFSLLPLESNYIQTRQITKRIHFNESVHSCLRALQEGDPNEFHMKINDSKKELVVAISRSSMESTENIYSTIVKLQILHHLGLAWNLRWGHYPYKKSKNCPEFHRVSSIIPTMAQMDVLIADWSFILKQARLHLNLLEPFIAFRRVLLQILKCNECTAQHLLQSASTFRKGSRFSQAAAAVHEFKLLNAVTGQEATSYSNSLGRLEEAKILWAQGQHDMAINLARYILQNYQLDEDASNVYRLVGKWLAENRSSNSRTILEQYLKQSVKLAELNKNTNENSISRQCQMYFHLAHYTDALFRSYEERLASSEWQAAMRLRKHKTKELDALIRRLKSSTKGEKNDYSIKIQELQKQLTMDREEAKKLQDDRDSFLSLSLEGYQRCLVLGDKYDLRVVFRLLSLWFSLSSRQSVVESMLNAVKEVQSYKFVPLVYQIASRMGGPKDGQGSNNFQHALVSLVKKMACDHPYHTIFQILALANGHRVKDKQRSRSSFIVDMDKKHAAENLLIEISSYHGDIIRQMKHMVEIYIKLAELETKKEDTNKKVALPRELRSAGQLELVPVVTATFPIDRSCRYHEGTFPHFKGLSDYITVMNGINAPKVVECLGSDGQKYRQLAKSGNDDLRQDAVMEQFFGLVNTFLLNHRDTWKRRIGIRTYKVVPFTPSAGVLEWVDRTVPLGEYLLGSTRNGGAHGRYGIGDWSFLRCREYMVNEKDKSKAFHKVCSNFRPVMHYFFLERFMHPADWFEKRLSYIRSVAASSMVGYIVGLGDRHSMNILIDETTAEVVHIDLGVAFEQGLMLKTPERVPFRLTRDVIDGMGVTGVEGVFRRCCEKTLSVMRTNKEALITIIEVFIHDPLYKWALSPLKALQRQKEIDDDMEFSLEDSQDEWEGNKDATRALLRVKQKLDGYDDGEMRSVQGQVQQLIHDATDSERLCQMFPGWGPWL